MDFLFIYKITKIYFNFDFRMDKEIRKIESEINKKRPGFIKAKERVTHIQKKLKSAQKSLAQAKKANDSHGEDIAVLEKELAEVDRLRDEYEENLQSQSQSQDRSVHLEDEQVSLFLFFLLMKTSSNKTYHFRLPNTTD